LDNYVGVNLSDTSDFNTFASMQSDPMRKDELLNTNFSANVDDNGIVFSSECPPANDGANKCFNASREKICQHRTQTVSLNLVGQYMLFPARWWHHGYFNIRTDSTYYTAQLFCTPSIDMGANQTRQKNKEMTVNQLDFEDVNDVSNDVMNNWDTTYSHLRFPPCKAFDGPIDPATNRHLQNDSFRSVPQMNALVKVFEETYTRLRVQSVWLIKKSKTNGGFQTWHRDFHLGPDITATIVVNLGVCEK